MTHGHDAHTTHTHHEWLIEVEDCNGSYRVYSRAVVVMVHVGRYLIASDHIFLVALDTLQSANEAVVSIRKTHAT
jgi:hypothetical protein